MTEEEQKLIELIRSREGYANFVVEKRPTKDCPEGKIVSVKCETRHDFFKKNERTFA